MIREDAVYVKDRQPQTVLNAYLAITLIKIHTLVCNAHQAVLFVIHLQFAQNAKLAIIDTPNSMVDCL